MFLSGSEKAICKSLTTIGTSIAAGLATHYTCKEINKRERKLSKYKNKKKRDREAARRVTRDSAIGAGYSLLFFAGRAMANDQIDKSDYRSSHSSHHHHHH